MKKQVAGGVFLWAVLVLVMGLWLALPVVAAEPVALVKAVKGDVKLATAGSQNWAPLYVLSELVPGDRIRVAAKGEVRIFFYSDTHSEIVKGTSTVRITVKKCELEKGARSNVTIVAPYRGMQAFRSIKASSEQFGGVALRSVIMLGIELLRPHEVIAQVNPTFEWNALSGVDDYLVALEDEQGNRLWEQACGESRLSYPESVALLDYEKAYFWIVIARNKGQVVARQSGGFRIISEDAAERLETLQEQTGAEIAAHPDDPGPHVVLFSFHSYRLPIQ